MRVIDEHSKEYYFETTKIIKDLVHGYINLTKFEIEIIDNVSFQRLKDIRQLTCHHVYPEARHTRFEHSLGVLELTRKAIKSLNWNGVIFNQKNKQEQEDPIISEILNFNVCIAALLHDVGHCTFSHMGESEFNKEVVRECLVEALEKLKSKDIKITNDLLEKIDIKDAKGVGSIHEQISCIVIINNFFDILNSAKIEGKLYTDFELIIRCILGIEYDVQTKEEFDKYKIHNAVIRLINSSIFDMDKLDYIMRDSYFTGIGTPTIDTKRLFRNMYFDNSYSLVFTSKAVPALQNMIDARDGLYMYVYNHHAVVFSDFLNTYIVRKITHSTELFEALCNKDRKDKKTISNIQLFDFVSNNYLFSIDAILNKYRSDSDWLSLLNSINTHYVDYVENKKIKEILNKEFTNQNVIISEKEINDLSMRINTSLELVHQLKTRQFLKPWWKTVFEFTNFMQKNFPDDNIRRKIGEYICNGGKLKGKYKLEPSEFRSQIAKHVTYISNYISEKVDKNKSPLIAPLSEGEFFVVQRSTRFFEPDTIEKLSICLKTSEITGVPKEADYSEQNYYVKSLTRIIPQKDYTSLYAKEGFYIFTAPIEQYKSLKNKEITYNAKKWQKHYECIENIFVFVATNLVTMGEQNFVKSFQEDKTKPLLERKEAIKMSEMENMNFMAEKYINGFIK